MICPEIEARWYAPAQIANGKNGSINFTFPLRGRRRFGKPNSLTALVASSDENLVQELAESTVPSGLATFVAFTIDESKRVLNRQRISVVVCDDRLIDGKYEDLVDETIRLRLKTPVIVISRTGNWPDYLKAIGAGAFDYLAYPPVPRDLPRIIRNALATPAPSNSQDTRSELLLGQKGKML